MFRHYSTGQLTILSLCLMGTAAIVGAVITSTVTGTIPHDLVGLAIAIVSFLVGTNHGKVEERLKANTLANGGGPFPPQ